MGTNLMHNCGIVKDGGNLKIYVDEIKLTLTKEQFDDLINLYTMMKNNIIQPEVAYVENGEMHFLKFKE